MFLHRAWCVCLQGVMRAVSVELDGMYNLQTCTVSRVCIDFLGLMSFFLFPDKLFLVGSL